MKYYSVKFKPADTREYIYRSDFKGINVGTYVDVLAGSSDTLKRALVIDISDQKPPFDCKAIHNISDNQLADEQPPAEMGHNNPPDSDYGEFEKKVTDFTSTAGLWMDLKAITTDEQSEKLVDFISGARGVYSNLDASRKLVKAPHFKAAKAVDAAFKPMLDKVEACAKAGKALQADWLVKVAEKQQIEQQRLLDESEVKRLAAEKLEREAADRNDISGRVEAQAAIKEVAKIEKQAASLSKVQAKSSSGGGRTISLRNVRSAQIDNLLQVFMHFRDDPKVRECLTALANAEIRTSKGDEVIIKGVTIITTQVAS